MTLCPPWTSRSHKCEPINPAPPVTTDVVRSGDTLEPFLSLRNISSTSRDDCCCHGRRGCRCLAVVSLKVLRALFGRVIAQEAPPRRRADLVTACVRHPQKFDHVLRVLRDQDLFAGLEQRLDAGPFVGNHRNTAGGGLE